MQAAAAGTPSDQATPEQATIVCCIEGGRLELQTVLMIETLRRFGGALGQSRVLAVVPRRGQPLAESTKSFLKDQRVELHDGRRFNKLPWFNWYAKVVAAQLADEVATTPVVIWLDSDALIAAPLVELGLPHGDDFAARREVLPPAVFTEPSEHDGYWRRACEIVGLRYEDIPWLPADGESPRQKMVFNAGINAFRRSRGFAETYADCTLRMMNARLARPNGNFWHNEQNAVTLTAVRLGLKVRELPLSENHMVFPGFIDGPEAAPSVADARLIHYSHSMNPEHWPRFMERLRGERPLLHDLLRPRGAIPDLRVPASPLAFARKVYRQIQYRLFAKRCRRTP